MFDHAVKRKYFRGMSIIFIPFAGKPFIRIGQHESFMRCTEVTPCGRDHHC